MLLNKVVYDIKENKLFYTYTTRVINGILSFLTVKYFFLKLQMKWNLIHLLSVHILTYILTDLSA